MIRIIEPDNYSEEAIEIYRRLGKVNYNHATGQDIQTKVIVIRLNHYIGSEMISAYPNLETIISPTTGFNHIDVELIKKKNIRLITLKDIPDKLSIIRSTSEHTLMMAIAINRKFGLYMHSYKYGNTPGVSMRDSLRGKELSHQNLGILGYGRIGRHVYEMSQSIWKRVKVWDINKEIMKQCNPADIERSAHELFMFADTLCICINYSEQNKGYVGKELLKNMKKGSSIVNTSRGEIIDEKEVITMLKVVIFLDMLLMSCLRN